jgi:hypothetical protein
MTARWRYRGFAFGGTLQFDNVPFIESTTIVASKFEFGDFFTVDSI